MFVLRSTHEAVKQMAAVHKTALDSAHKQMAQMREDVISQRKEIRRLTNVIIHLKEQGQALSPADTDQRWGSYTFDELDQLAQDKGPALPEPTMADDEVAYAEAELRAELEAALDAE